MPRGHRRDTDSERERMPLGQRAALIARALLEPARAIRHRAGACHRVAHLLHAHRKRGVRHRAARASRLAGAGPVRGWAAPCGGGEEVLGAKALVIEIIAHLYTSHLIKTALTFVLYKSRASC
jgi:hypothetical protein